MESHNPFMFQTTNQENDISSETIAMPPAAPASFRLQLDHPNLG